MLVDRHIFRYSAVIPWPLLFNENGQMDWIQGLDTVEEWLLERIGPRYQQWAWHDSSAYFSLGVAFKYDASRTLFILSWDQ
jgi:hypothetical protein